MKRIILPTDFSENSMNAIRYAMRLFEKESCTFYLLNTFTPAAYYVGTNMMNSNSALQLEQVAIDNANKGLEEIQETLKSEFSNPNHTIEKRAAFNLLVSEILTMEEEMDIDLVVMGTKGATGAKEVFLGTQTMYTIKNVSCPVIAVPSDFHYENPKEILFPTDFKFDTSNPFLPLVKELSQQHTARINVLNAYYGEPLSDAQNEKKDFLDSYFDSTAHIFHTAEGVDVVEAVEEFQIKHKINFLVMIHNRHSFFENLLFRPVINQIAYHTHVPFLVIPSVKRMKH
ncbi:MAG: universal stress protein [Flavobacteriaceae bacterium]|nr:universal stress protein [Flavobacteriaceae bacterium]